MMLYNNTLLRRRCRPALIPALACFLQTLAAFPADTETVLAQGTVISLQMNDHLSTRGNNEGDSFTAVVISPVCAGERVVIPKGSYVTGSISRVTRPGRFKGKAVLNLIFHSVQIPGKGELPIAATLTRVDSDGNPAVRNEGAVEGAGSEGRDAGRIIAPGLAGAGIGAIAGGGKGARIGAGAGTAVGLSAVFSTRGKDLEIRRGSTIQISLDKALAVPLEAESGGDGR